MPTRATVVRWGGEEFLIYIPEVDFSEVESIGAKMLSAIGKTPIETSHSNLTVTASIGVARLPFMIDKQTMLAEQAVSLADAALYRAKQTGRNRAVSLTNQTLANHAEKTAVENDFTAAQHRGLINTVDIPGPAMDTSSVSYLKKAG